MSDSDDIFSDPPETMSVEVSIPADLYADLAGAVVSDEDPPRAIIEVGELISLIVQEAWKDADENTAWLDRVSAQISSDRPVWGL